MKKPDIKIIYVDMDGVLADFRKRYIEKYDVDPEVTKKLDHWKDFVETEQFEKLDLMPDAKHGLKFLRKQYIPVKILSSTAHENSHHQLEKQKKKWLKEKEIDFDPIFVPGKRLKPQYAEKGAILIDDSHSTIEKWIEAGGIGIYHTDWDTTLMILKMFV